jgi:hypothetical protein
LAYLTCSEFSLLFFECKPSIFLAIFRASICLTLLRERHPFTSIAKLWKGSQYEWKNLNKNHLMIPSCMCKEFLWFDWRLRGQSKLWSQKYESCMSST